MQGDKKQKRHHPFNTDGLTGEQLVENDDNMEFLARGSHNKKIPVQCNACVRPHGKHGPRAIFDLINLKYDHWYYQHVLSATHIRYTQDQKVSGVKNEESQLQCAGWQMSKAMLTCRLSRLGEGLVEYATVTSTESTEHMNRTMHSFNVIQGKDVVIKHRNCAGLASTVSQGHPMCPLCFDIGQNRNIAHQTAKLFVKTLAARLLSCRLFSIEAEQGFIQEARKSSVYKAGWQAALEKVLKMKVSQLQKFVRTSWLSLGDEWRTPAYKQKVACLVAPCLSVNLENYQPEVAQRASGLAKAISSGQLHTIADVELKLAASVANGALRHHPLVQGLLVAAVEQSRRLDRGANCMRNLQVSETERNMMIEAAVVISQSASSKDLLKTFGIACLDEKVQAFDPGSASLPDPWLANDNITVLENNARMIQNAIPLQKDWVTI